MRAGLTHVGGRVIVARVERYWVGVLLAAFSIAGITGMSSAPAFQGAVGPTPGIYVISPDGTGQRRLVRTESSGFSWSPDSTSIVLAVGAYIPEGDDLFIASVIGGPLKRLTRSPRSWELEPAWSPDGRTIAYAAVDETQAATRTRIWTVNANGASRRRLSPLTDAEERSPAWAPDSARIAFLHDISAAQFNVYSMAANGSERTRLTRALQDEESSITWSPSGSDIALLRTANARDPGHARIDVWMMRADGSGQTRVTDKANFGSLCWSADGQVLAYVSRGQISLTRLATGKSRRIYTPGQLDAFSWSPDGKTFAVILTRAGRTDLHTVSADGTGNLRRLTNDRIAETNPQWSPDGKLIGFARRSD